MHFPKILLRRVVPLFLLVTVMLAALALRTVWPSRAEKASAPDATHTALRGLASTSAFERANAVKALRVLRDTGAVPALIDHLDDPDQAVGLYIAQALGDMATPEAFSDLRAALRSQDPKVRWRAAYALGELRDAAAVDGLSALLRDPDVLVQRTAATSLAQIGNRAAMTALVGVLGSPIPSASAASMTALESLGETAVPSLIAGLDSSNALMRKNAATVLGYIASPRATAVLQLAVVDPDPAVQGEARWALEQIAKS